MCNVKYTLVDYGINITLKHKVCKYDLLEHIDKIKSIADQVNNIFHVMFDFSELSIPLCSESVKVISVLRAYMIGKGAVRIVILYNSNAQIVDLAKTFDEVNFHKHERYVSNMINKDAINYAVQYLKEGKEL